MDSEAVQRGVGGGRGARARRRPGAPHARRHRAQPARAPRARAAHRQVHAGHGVRGGEALW